MEIEYGILNTRKLKTEALETKLNDLVREGWRVKCSVGYRLVLFRKIDIEKLKV